MGGPGGWIGLAVVLVILVIILPWILYIRSLQLTFSAIDPRHREMKPGTVWLLLIPLFQNVWIFIVVARLRKSFKNLEDAGQLKQRTTAGSDVGLAMAICFALSLIPYIGVVTSIIAVILWIIHWVAIVNARNDILTGYEAERLERHGPQGASA